MKAIFVSKFDPVPIGDGGNHRAYQIVQDLTEALGREAVLTMSYPANSSAKSAQMVATGADSSLLLRRIYQLAQRVPPLRPMLSLWKRARIGQARRRLPYLWSQHPVDLLAHTSHVVNRYNDADFVARYRERITTIEKPVVCFVEHVGFSTLIELNRQAGVPTVLCPQNLEALDEATPLSTEETREIYLTSLALADELVTMAQCEARLFISKVEMAFVTGLGIPSQYYPYRPVGAIRNRLIEIRSKREKRLPEPGLFLMLGTTAHTTTSRSFAWFIEQATRHGLPSGIRVVVGGRGTDTLVPDNCPVTGLELRGWMRQDELDAILTQVCGVLVPQNLGFGALTRLAELSCAGIPVVVSRYATLALDPPPGIQIVDDDWQDWRDAMIALSSPSDETAWADYLQWEDMQRFSINDFLNALG